ncbi:hypothetical protein GCM10025875_35440 [Litorihabitans aurantiacus]|uniref:Uncharacterized protein n=1 Tax=Litorihabitans aurantiacus TaxID=1930061 RepID=A0AA37UGP9_9MICO|nr:hypothetical protein GCM10025875_00460 [Litorihabitans aurantiacus]GMA33552.1 hypothetical protein GCM10025875_35440 [Litorihabitans aurantiacus]
MPAVALPREAMTASTEIQCAAMMPSAAIPVSTSEYRRRSRPVIVRRLRASCPTARQATDAVMRGPGDEDGDVVGSVVRAVVLVGTGRAGGVVTAGR